MSGGAWPWVLVTSVILVGTVMGRWVEDVLYVSCDSLLSALNLQMLMVTTSKSTTA